MRRSLNRPGKSYHPDRPYRAAASCGIADVRSPTPSPRQGSLHAYVGRAEGRPMIAADTSTWVVFLEGGAGEDTQLLDRALEDRQVVMVPVVLTELLSDPKLPSGIAETLSAKGRWVASEGTRKAPQGAVRRRADRPELHRRRRSSPHARPGLPSVRRSCRPQSCTWVRNRLTRFRPAFAKAIACNAFWTRGRMHTH